jgi:hypothetical protein
MAVTIGFDQEINICSETKDGLRDGIRRERSWRLSSVRGLDGVAVCSGLSPTEAQAPFFPMKAKNRRVRSPWLLFGCFDLGGYEIVR